MHSLIQAMIAIDDLYLSWQRPVTRSLSRLGKMLVTWLNDSGIFFDSQCEIHLDGPAMTMDYKCREYLESGKHAGADAISH